MRHIKKKLIKCIELNLEPKSYIQWREKKNIFGYVVKEGFAYCHNPNDFYVLNEMPDGYIQVGPKKVIRKPEVGVTTNVMCYWLYFDSKEEATSFYLDLLNNVKTMDYVPFYKQQ